MTAAMEVAPTKALVNPLDEHHDAAVLIEQLVVDVEAQYAADAQRAAKVAMFRRSVTRAIVHMESLHMSLSETVTKCEQNPGNVGLVSLALRCLTGCRGGMQDCFMAVNPGASLPEVTAEVDAVLKSFKDRIDATVDRLAVVDPEPAEEPPPGKSKRRKSALSG